MDNYTLSYSRKKKLEKEETALDEEVNKAKVINSFDGTTLDGSLKELDEFISDGTVRNWIVTHPLMIIPVSLIFMLLTDIAIVLVHDDDKEEEFYVAYDEDEFRCFNKLQSTGIDDDGNLIIKIGRF